MLWLVAPSVAAVAASSALLAAGCAKGRDDAKRPKSSGSNRARSNKQKQQSGRSSSRKPHGAASSSRSSRRDPKTGGSKAGAAKKPHGSSSRSKREGGSSKSGSRSAKAKPLADGKKTAAPAGAAVVANKSSKSKSGSSKRRSERDKKDKSVDSSQRSSRSKEDKSKRSKSRSKSKSKSKRSSRSKRSSSKKEVPLQVEKTQEASGEGPTKPKTAASPASKTAPIVAAPAVSVTTIDLAAPEGVAKHEVRVEPSELRWKPTGGIQNVAVYNHSAVRKALKIKCSDNLLYRVNPVHAFVPAGGSVRVDILRQAGAAKVDKIVFIVADAGSDAQNAREALSRAGSTDMMVLPLIATPAY